MTESRAGTTATVTVTLVIAVVAATIASGATIGGALDHERAISGSSAISSMAWFIAGWTLMMLAMMLPTAATLVAAVGRLAESPLASVRLQAATSVVYLATWAAIGYLFRAGDVFIHTLVDEVGWVLKRPGLVDAAVLLIAGAFQFSSLKHRCLTACRAPTSFVYRYWRGGNALGSAARVGAAYGFSCVGCCWALMLVMFAFGVMSPLWMLLFGSVMAIEKSTRFGRHVSTPLGVGLLAAALIVAFRT